MSKKAECKFCNLELPYRRDCIVAHLEYKNNDNKMRGGGHCFNVKGMLSKFDFPSGVVYGWYFWMKFWMITLRT